MAGNIEDLSGNSGKRSHSLFTIWNLFVQILTDGFLDKQ